MPRKAKNATSSDLPSWVDSRQEQGLYFFTREEALKSLECTEEAFKKAAARLAKKNRIMRIRSGFFVIVPLEYRATGILPAEWFIADLMAYLEQPYYVGLLSGASLQGAAHQKPQQFQVVTTVPQREVRKKGLAMRFFSKTNFMATPVTQIKVQTGHIAISSPEATALDLIRYARSIGGLDRAMTVFQELGESMDAGKLIIAVEAEGSLVCAQRLGWLMEKAGYAALVKDLAGLITDKNPPFTRLDPSLPTGEAERDIRWRLLINTDVEGDL
ncbi:MAG: type IV toxin-antitoxin system AbiEi family antitoxin [Syntrophobacterales bacterium]|nr:type IV toxin-antitoxin system AbiEi family antitoxin [Syntrophobacterales bacterium]